LEPTQKKKEVEEMYTQEFTTIGIHRYNQSSVMRWIAAHILRYKGYLAIFIITTIMTNSLNAAIPIVTGTAFDIILHPNVDNMQIMRISLNILGLVLLKGVVEIIARVSTEFLGKGFARDARDELYVGLLGKSQTFHNRQRVGDLMARATNDINQLSNMIVPGLDTIIDAFVSLITTLIFIGLLRPWLLLGPCIFTVLFLISLRAYNSRLNPIASAMRSQFGKLNADITEVLVGIGVVKSTVQEESEIQRFNQNAQQYRDLFVENGRIQARYLPILLLSFTLVGAFFHGIILVHNNQLSIGELVSYIGLVSLLSYPASISNWAFNLVQSGLAGAKRIIALLKEDTALDENTTGYHDKMQGDLVFENVSFGYDQTPVLKHISFQAKPGQMIAIVGQTGSGKSTLTKLVNRIYDADQGRILIDGIDVHSWSLDALRSQISTIEQDIVLFSRSIAENIAFSVGQKGGHQLIEQAAKDAQAHDFIMNFKDGYETIIGERGVTLSGGQRQRLAIARALLTDPRILVLDDSTSAIDSATEDEIQQAIRRLLKGRTTLLITHRLSQIRQADLILVLRQGVIVDQGTHQELLVRCAMYQRIFAHYESTINQQPALVAKEKPVQERSME
jgi:ATP-binding cassette, subfamily B, bacterial